MTISSIPVVGYDGDPQNQQSKDINTSLGQANTDITATVAAATAADNAQDALFGRGVATLLDTTTAIVVTHGLATTPLSGDIMVCPIEDWGAMTSFWVDTLTATEFTINADQDPTADVDFAWQFQQVD